MKMTELPLGDKVLLTSAQVAQWRDEYAAYSSQRDDIAAKLAKLEEKLGAVSLLTGVSIASLLGDDEEDETAAKESMTGAIKRVISQAGQIMSRHEIRSSLMAEPEWGDRLRRNPNTFYNAMNRLMRRGELRQDGERFGLP